MSKIAIVVDSSFQIKEEQYKDFFVLPLVVTEVINGKTKDYLDMIDIDSEQVSEKLKEGIEIKTSMVPPGRTMALLDRISPLYDQVFMMCIPSKLSSMFNVVSNLAKDYPNVKVFDQSMVATMSTWMVSEIMKARDEGILTEEWLREYLKKFVKNTALLMVVPDVKFLAKGGRISNGKALLVKMLKLNIMISLDERGLVFYDKAKSIEGVVKKFKTFFGERLGKIDPAHACFLNQKNADEKFNINAIKEALIEAFKFSGFDVEHANIPSAIVAHTGPNYIALAISNKE